MHSQIRDRARRRYRNSDRSQSCERCGYKKHIEICHIKAIADYPLETPVSEVNDLNNLVGLCPNCHWELDHGELTIEEIRSIEDDSS
ncbi:MAG: HNH endonuclease [Chloroflexota bacterium]